MRELINKKNYQPLINLQQSVKKWASEYSQKNIESLDMLHFHIKENEVNSLRMHLFNKLNSEFDWRSFLFEMIGKELINVVGPDISIQNKINLSIKLPQDETSNLGLHSDSWSNESPFQLNAWIPLTNVFGSNGMYLLGEDISLLENSKIKVADIESNNKIKFEDKDFVRLDFGEILLFNPSLLHGNITNRTNKTRISIHTRFKNLYAPETKDFPDRALGIFYEPLICTKNTEFALKVLGASGGISIIKQVDQ